MTGDAERAEITHRVVPERHLPELCREMYLLSASAADVSYWLPIHNRCGW
ncbi:MAG: hypothetical protein ACLUZQ_04580 [Butyricicoccus sp.]